MRLQKFLARAGVASRRASERIIEAGRVSVDGEIVTRLGTTVDETSQVVRVDGLEVRITPRRWIMLHKPPGSLCSRGDPDGRPTIYDLLPDDAVELFHVGRLDYMSEGLLLLTNDGGLANGLLHPSSEIERRYAVTLVGPVSAGATTALVRGVQLEDGPAAAAQAVWTTSPNTTAPVLELTLLEGRNREIRRMIASLDLKIRTLARLSFGPIELGDLHVGEWRELSEDELDRLAKQVPERGGTVRQAE